MGYNTKNYTEQGGDKTVIGGKLNITKEGKLSFRGAQLKPASSQVNCVGTTGEALKNYINELLVKLQNAGLMERASITLEEDSEVTNKINTLSTYNNVANEADIWVVDAIVSSSQLIPAGTAITINNPAIGGEPYVLEKASNIIWLSDVIKGQNSDVPTRTKLNLHTEQAFDFTVSDLEADLTTELTFTIVISDREGLANTKQSEKDFGEYTVLTSNTLVDVTFTADE